MSKLTEARFYQELIEDIQMIADAFRKTSSQENKLRLAKILILGSDFYREDQEIIDYYGETYLKLLKSWRIANTEILQQASTLARNPVAYPRN